MTESATKDTENTIESTIRGSDNVRTQESRASGLADRVRRALVGKKRADVLEAAGLSKMTLARVLAGHPIRDGNLGLLAEALGVSRDWLVHGYGPMELPSRGSPTREQMEELAKQPDLPDPPKTTPLFGALDINRMATAIDIAEDAFAKRKHNPSSRRKAQVYLTIYDALEIASPNKVRELIHLWDMEDLQQSDQV